MYIESFLFRRLFCLFPQPKLAVLSFARRLALRCLNETCVVSKYIPFVSVPGSGEKK